MVNLVHWSSTLTWKNTYFIVFECIFTSVDFKELGNSNEMLKLYQNDSIKDWKMKNIDTILSTFLTGYIKCNTKTHLLVSHHVKLFFLYLSVGIYRNILV